MVIHLRVLHFDDELSTFGKQPEKKTKLIATGKKEKEEKRKTHNIGQHLQSLMR